MTLVSTFSQGAFAAALLEPDHSLSHGLRTWNGSDPIARLAIHRNNVVSSLIDALAETFPVVQQLVGEEFFRGMAGAFVRQAPPRSRVLAHYGEKFPSFIEQFEPAQSLAYLADVARLEMARVRAYHAADAEPVATESVSLALASGDRIGELRLVCHPSVSAVASPYAIVSLWAAHQGDGGVEGIDVDMPEYAIVTRQGLDVLVLRAPVGAVEFVITVQQGRCLEDAVATAASAARGFDLAETLSLLLGHGALTSLHLPLRQFS